MGIFMLLGGFFLIFETIIPRNLLSRYSWFISLPKFRTRSWLSYPASEVAENEARLREARIKEREAVGHES